MCSGLDDPTTYDILPTPRATCGETIATAPGPYGENRLLCGQVVGVTTWTDEAGMRHSACALHVEGMKRRWRESVTA